MRLFSAVLLFLCLTSSSSLDAYKILVFSPRVWQSMSNYLGTIADTLVDAGHNVTTLIPIVDPRLHDGSQKTGKIYVAQNEETRKLTDDAAFDYFDYNTFDLFASIGMGDSAVTWLNAQCKAVLDEPGLIERLRAEKYDVVLVESFEACGIAVSWLIEPKALITSSVAVPFGPITGAFGLDPALSYNPSTSVSRIDIHSFWSRAFNCYAEFVARMTWRLTHQQIDDLFYARYGAAFPGVYQIASNAAFSYVNSEPLVDFAAPTLNRVQFIGGIGARDPKPLDKEIDALLNLRSRTVLLSLGSVVAAVDLPTQVKQSIIKTIARFPDVTFLWKYERPEDDFAKAAMASAANLHMLKWAPQTDLLADPRLTAFITHGGMSSTQEVTLRGKPCLFVPFMEDQPRNAGMMEKSGVGRVFDKMDLYDAEKFYAAVKDLLENDSYREAAVRLSAMIARKPFSAKEIVIRTVEFAAEFGPAAALRPQSYDMNWVEYHNADVIAAFIGASLSLVYIACRLVMLPFTMLLSGRKVKSD